MEAAIRLSADLDEAAIIQMHAALLEGARPDLVGEYRREQVWIGGRLPHDADFVPPHHERVPHAMRDLIEFVSRTDLPVLVHAAIAHAQFETIHPFPDGNGRTGRAIVHAMLHSGDLVRHTTIPVSAGLLGDVDGYFAALAAYRRGDAQPIVLAFAAAALRGVAHARDLGERIRELNDGWRAALGELRADAAAHRLVEATIGQPVLTSRVAADLIGSSVQTALAALEQLTDRGILTLASSRRRNRVWLNPQVIDALDDFAARATRRGRA
jgi:Fic family protein